MEQKTVSGKPLTYPVSFRLTLSYYERLCKRAVRENKTISVLVKEWVIERLEKPLTEDINK